MAISAFPILTKVTLPTYSGGADILSTPLVFGPNTSTNNKLGTPANTMREIQIQFATDTSGILSVSFDDSEYFAVNNGDGIVGLATFTIFVDNTTELNFQFENGASIIITIGG